MLTFRREAYVARTETSVVSASNWQEAYARYVNNQGITLLIDEESVIAGQDAYLDDNAELMLEKELIRTAFDCSVIVYDESTIRIAKGENVITVNVGEFSMSVTKKTENGVEIIPEELSSSVVKKGKKFYVPSEVIIKGLDYDYSWGQSAMNAIFVSEDPEVGKITSYYSYADIGRISYVRNQGNLGACWAFAGMAALEYTLLPEENWDFSEDHLIWNNGHALDNYGGDYLITASYLTGWKGPVREEDDPYNDGMTDENLSAVKHVQEIQFLNSKDYTQIKKMIFKYGVVESSLYIGVSEDNSEIDSECYFPETYSYIYTGDELPNHEIVIIGWDDDYPADNFGGHAEGDGAFICKNSWGSGFGDNGTFYVSYYDSVIGYIAVAYTKIEDTDNYDRIYQYDDTGWSGLVGFGQTKAYMANVYTASGSENLEAVGFYATGENTSYKIYVCENYKDSSSIDVKSKVYAQGTFKNSGYYTVQLDEEVKLDAGEKFAVVVEIITPSSGKPVAVEIISDEADADTAGKVSLLSNYGEKWECLQDKSKGNICLKAYTKVRED